MHDLEEAPETVTIGPEEMRFIRALRAEWSWIEAGAPRVALLAPGADDLAIIARVGEVTGPWLVADAATLTSVYRRGMLAAAAFLTHVELAPGAYEFDSPFPPSQLDLEPFARSSRVRIQGGTVRMDVTPEHLALLKGSNVRLFDEGGVRCETAIDPKRPYGEMIPFYADMARILEVEPEGPLDDEPLSQREWSEDQLRWLHDLHVTTQPALQIVLQQGTARMDTYRRDPAGHGAWIVADL